MALVATVAWESFYKTARWRRLRKLQLIQHPLCKFCLERGIVTSANVVDHVVPHTGDWTKFVTGELQSFMRAVPSVGEAADMVVQYQ
jgi:5-methylcytosine-specific restriction endonuclease McrA